MKRYLSPEMNLVILATEDVIATSAFQEGDATKLPTISFGDFKF